MRIRFTVIALLAALPALALCSPAVAQTPLRVALLLESPEGANTWNMALAAGLERAGRDFQVRTTILVAQEGVPGKGATDVFRAAAAANDLVLVATDAMHEVLRDNAANFRRVMFGCIDAGIRAPNIMSVTFADEQAAYLAGAAAALLARSNMPGVTGKKTLGWLSGQDTPALRSLLNGFTEGARIIDPEMRVIHAVSGSFANADAARREARKLLDQGAVVLVLACGQGEAEALEEVRERHAYAVGLDMDRDALLPGRVLTSILKHPDKAVYDLVAAAAKGAFKGKEIRVWDLANGGVDITAMRPFKATASPQLIRDMERRLAELRGEIQRGGIRLKSLRARTLCDCL